MLPWRVTLGHIDGAVRRLGWRLGICFLLGAKKKKKGIRTCTDLETNTATTKLLHGINGDLSLINAGFVGGQL